MSPLRSRPPFRYSKRNGYCGAWIFIPPKHGSWLNMAEIEFRVLSRHCQNRRIADKATLISEVAAWEAARNAAATPVDWRFTTHDARIKLKHLYPVIHN